MARRTGKMSDDDLARIIDGQISDALTYSQSDRAGHREKALRYFEGEVPEFPALEGRSSVVSRDVSDLHGLILPSLLRVFFSSDRIAVYEPTREEHEEYADQATDYVNHVVMKECGGYRLFRDAFADGILIGNGILKHWWDNTPEYSCETFAGLRDDQYRMLLQDPDFHEEVEHKEYPDPAFALPPEAEMMIAQAGGPEALEAMGMPVPQPELLHDVTIKRLKSSGRLKAAAVPDEEFLIDRAAKCLDETLRFCAHVSRVTRSDLIQEGYPRAKIDDIPSYDTDEINQARQDRDDLLSLDDNPPDKSTEYVQRYECYVLMDYDGDGIAERRRIIAAGGTGKKHILSNEKWGDDLPFSDVVPDPRPHTWRGRGIFDDAADMMRVKTMALRGILDNTYQVMHPQQQVYQGSIEPTSMGEVVNPTYGGILLAKSGVPAGSPLVLPVTHEHIAPQIAPVLDYCDKILRRRTGISEDSMALDLDKLQNQTATAAAMASDQAHSKTEEYARNIANFGGLKRFFGCCLKLITKYQDRPKTIRLRGKWVEMDPRGWDAGMDVTVNVGLGTGTRDRDLTMLMGVRNAMKEYIGVFGPFNEYCNVGHLMDVDRKMVEAAGLSNPESYFKDISQEEIEQKRAEMAQQGPPPDPKVEEAKAKLQVEMAKMEKDHQLRVAELQMKWQAELDRTAAATKSELEKLGKQVLIEEKQAAADIEVERIKAQYQAELQQQKFEFQKQLEMMKLRIEAWRDMRSAAAAAQPGVDVGGMPDFGSEGMDPEMASAMQVPPTPLEQQSQAIAAMGDSLREGLSMIEKTMRVLAAPNVITRDDKGRVVGSVKDLASLGA